MNHGARPESSLPVQSGHQVGPKWDRSSHAKAECLHLGSADSAPGAIRMRGTPYSCRGQPIEQPLMFHEEHTGAFARL